MLNMVGTYPAKPGLILVEIFEWHYEGQLATIFSDAPTECHFTGGSTMTATNLDGHKQ